MEELAPERRAIAAALEDLRIDPWVYESSAGARSQTIRDTYIEELEGTDLYIGVFWKGYGEHTVEEFELARRCQKDCLIYLKRTADVSDRDPRLRKFLHELSDVDKGLTIRWFQGPEDLAEAVKDDVAGWQSDIVLDQSHPGPEVPLQAPPLPDEYVERQVVGRMKDTLLVEYPPVTRAALQGMGGLGKSVTAAAFARDEDVVSHFEDGVLWVTLGQHPDLRRRLADWGAALSDPLVLTSRYPDAQTGSQRLRTRLEGKKCLLVVDDAWRPEDVKPFLVGGPRCVLLVTTRKGEVVDAVGATGFPLEFMDEEEALTLLRNRLGTMLDENEDAARRIASELGGVPQAIELAAARVKRLRSWQAFEKRWQSHKVEALKRGRRADSKEDNLTLSLEMSVSELDDDDRQRLERLAAVPEDVSFPVEIAAALWDMDALDAEDVLVDFVDQALLSRVETSFGLHDLMHDLLQQHLGPEGLQAAHASMVDGIRELHGGTGESRDQYVRNYLAYHLESAGRHAELFELVLGNPDWARERYAAEATFAGFADDLERAWTRSSGEEWDIGRQVRCAIIGASTRSLAGNLSPELLDRAVTEGRMSMIAALGEVARMPKAFDRSRALQAISDRIPTARVPQALGIARDIPEARSRVEALLGLMSRLPIGLRTEVLSDVLEDVAEIEELHQARILSRVARSLPVDMRPSAVLPADRLSDPGGAYAAIAAALPGALDWEILDATHAIEDEGLRERVLARVAPALGRERFEQVLAAVRDMSDPEARARMLLRITSGLQGGPPQALAEEALEAVRSLGREDDLLGAGTMLFPALSPQTRAEILPQARARAEAVENTHHRARSLLDLAAKVGGDDGREIAAAALEAARKIVIEKDRVGMMMPIAPLLSEDDVLRLLSCAGELTARGQRIRLLTVALPLLPERLHGDVVETLLVDVENSRSAFDRIDVWNKAVPFLSDEQLDRAISFVMNGKDAGERHWELGKIFENLSEDRRLALLERAGLTGDYVKNKESPAVGMKLLTWFALGQPDLWGEDPIEDQLARARVVDDLRERGSLLASLYSHLPPGRRAEAFEECLTVAEAIDHDIGGSSHAWIRSHVLVGLGLEVSEAELQRVLEHVDRLPDPEACISARARLAGAVLASSRDAFVREALDAVRSSVNAYHARDALEELIPHLTEQAAVEALEIVRAIEEPEARAFLLTRLISRLPENERDAVAREVVECSYRANFATNRLYVLLRLAKEAPESCRELVLSEARSALQDVDMLEERIRGRLELAIHLAEPERKKQYEEAVRLASSLTPPRATTTFLECAEDLPEETLRATIADGSRLAWKMPVGRTRGELLLTLVKFTPAVDRVRLLNAALESALDTETIGGYERTEMLSQIFRSFEEINFRGLEDGRDCLASCLRELAEHPRRELLNDLTALLPLIAHVGGVAGIEGTFEAVRDVCRWWP